MKIDSPPPPDKLFQTICDEWLKRYPERPVVDIAEVLQRYAERENLVKLLGQDRVQDIMATAVREARRGA